MPSAFISFPFLLNLGLLLSIISTPGYPTFLMDLIIFFSITMSTGPIGGLPLPLTNVAPLIIS